MTDPYTILRAFVAAYHGDAIADSDLYDEQPRTITVTLGDIRRAQAALGEQYRKQPGMCIFYDSATGESRIGYVPYE